VDTLSRLTGYDKGKLDNTGVMILKDQLFRGIKTEEKLHIKKLCKEARCPMRGSDEVVGWDLYSTEEKEIPSGGYSLITTGISIAIPQGTYAQIVPRSGLVVKNMIATGVGVIDTDYRGEVKVLLFNYGKQPFLIKDGNQVAQMILEKYKKTEIEETEDFNETTRGIKGFGSSRIRSINKEETLGAKIRKNYKDYKIDTDIQG
jgi:dUTP pyrophosphatase